jgi:uncharacterized protein (TIGR02246 family)
MDAASMRWTIRASLPRVLVAVALLALTGPANGRGATDDQAIRKVITGFVDAINRNDIKAFEALFTDDADFVVITGKYLKGLTEIVTYHAELFTGSFKGSHLDITSTDIRFLRPDVAIARVATKRTENEGKEMRTSFPIFVLTRRADKWLITAVQNTLTSGPPIPPVGTAK